MSSSAASAPTHRAEPPKEKRVFRTDVHGLRGLAVFLVVIYHVFVGRVSGGVDVFLFISAYFLTGTFVRRMETGKPIAAVGYWGRTFKRLLPPTVVVTFAILAATYLFLPASTYVPMLKDAFLPSSKAKTGGSSTRPRIITLPTAPRQAPSSTSGRFPFRGKCFLPGLCFSLFLPWA